MSLDYQQIRAQVKKMGESAQARHETLQEQYQKAWQELEANAGQIDFLRHKVGLAVRHDPTLRCANPVSERLDASFPPPPPPSPATILAADGSQIDLDRHSEVDYALVNVGAISMVTGAASPPQITVNSQLLFDEALYTLTKNTLALLRDLEERRILAHMAEGAQPPVFTFTDGPMELWGGKDGDGALASEYQQKLGEYLHTLDELRQRDVATAGYVDKPAANLVVRLLEIAITAEQELGQIKHHFPLRGVTDFGLYQGLLQPGQRSAVFAMQSQSARSYRGDLALHFFYLNVGRESKPWLARVEIPAWVAANPTLLNGLHTVLVEQCRLLGSRPYPYLLHRAHEAAVVTLQDREQVTQMIALELRRNSLPVVGPSNKQANKDLAGRTRYKP